MCVYIYIHIRTHTDMFGVEGLEKLHIYICLSIQIHVYMHIDVCTLQVHMLFSHAVGGWVGESKIWSSKTECRCDMRI